MSRIASLLVIAALCGLARPSTAVDKSGVTPNAISLPTGPGSIEGLGESFQPDLNTGTAKYTVSLELPQGTAGHAPSLALDYDGGGSNGPLGFGWKLGLPFVQRRTDEGIPRYVDDANSVDDDRDGEIDEPDELDVFITESGEELVLRADGYWFCENEGSFVRYRRVGEHWEAHLPDGTLLELGVTAEARLVDPSTGEAFRWYIEKSTDTNGNIIQYRYRSFSGDENLNQRYVWKVEYGPGARPWSAFHFVVFEYESRDDWFEDARAGFLVRTGRRIREVVVGTQGVDLPGHATGDFNADGGDDFLNRKYRFDYSTHPHWSLLSGVTRIGADGVSTLPPMILGYTVANLPDLLNAASAVVGSVNAPFQVMDNDLVDLVDLNGDALPDILRTESTGGPHSVFYNEGEGEEPGSPAIRWAVGQEVGGDALARNVNLASTSGAVAHLADMDADGLADLVYESTGAVYYFANDGQGAWRPRALMNLDPGDASPPSPFGAADVKTADIDFDKRMDVIQSVAVGQSADYRIWLNLGAQRWARSLTVPQQAGFMLSSTGVQIADWNGDRVPDVARVRPTGIEFTAGLGYGRFAPLVFVPVLDHTLTSTQVENAVLQDITGDGLVDLVINRAAPGQLWYWVNLGNQTLDHRRVITGMPTSGGVGSEFRWADLNGNGSVDLVLADSTGAPRLQTVDIGRLIGSVPSPNLLVRVENGIGRKTTIEYTTSTAFLRADAAGGEPWPQALPLPINVVSRIVDEDGLGGRYVTEFLYHDGHYDGAEKAFRGFARTEQKEVGDTTAPDLVTAYVFDTGVDEEPLKGKILEIEARDAAGSVFYRERHDWAVRTLAGSATGDGRSVRFAYRHDRMHEVLERGSGTPVNLRWEYELDDYGNVTRQVEHGRLDAGWDDEREITTTYTSGYPSGLSRWILRGVVEQTTADEQGSRTAHRRSYYDGNSMLGEVQKGRLSRLEEWLSDEQYVVTERNEHDAYGNLVATQDALYGAVPGHRRELVWDDTLHAHPVREVVRAGNTQLPALMFTADYDTGLGVMTASTDLNGHVSRYEYDAFGRLTAMARPPDVADTVEYEYVVARPLTGGRVVNWVETRRRDERSGDGELRHRSFTDGMNRSVMTRADGAGAQVVVTDVVEYNARRGIHRQYLPYLEAGSLDYQSPSSARPHTENWYDPRMRVARVNQPEVDGARAFATTEYSPLARFERDEEQSDPSSPHFGSGTRFVEDGLRDDAGRGRLREVWQIVKLGDEGEPIAQAAQWRTQYHYDLRGNVTRVIDSQGNERSFVYDGMGRKVSAADPDRGLMSYVYDAASNVIGTIDAKGQRIVYGYDGANRLESEDYLDDALPLSAQRSPDVSYHYDLPAGPVEVGDGSVATAANTLGRVSWIEDLSGEEHSSYDERGRVEWIVKKVRDPATRELVPYRIARSYDSMDRVVSLTYPDGDRLHYAYDERGLLEEIRGGPGVTVARGIGYDAAGQVTRLELGNGVVRTRDYDERLRLSGMDTYRGAEPGAPILSFAYDYDAVGNIRRIDDRRPVEVVPPGDPRRNTQAFAYDDLYRLVQVAYSFAPPGEPDAANGAISYRYDRIGNMLEKISGIDHVVDGYSVTDPGTMSYGGSAGSAARGPRQPGDAPGPHALTSTDNGSEQRGFDYDDNGNLAPLDERSFVWDYRDRLLRVSSADARADYVYDYGERRILKNVTPLQQTGAGPHAGQEVVYVDSFFEVRDGQPLKYVFVGPSRVARVSGTLDASAPRVQRLRLYEGWNLLAVSVSAGAALTQEDAIEAIFVWDAGSGAWLPADRSIPLDQGMLLWIRTARSAILSLVGSRVETTGPTAVVGTGFYGNSTLGAVELGEPPAGASLWYFDARDQAWLGRDSGEAAALSDPLPETLRAGAVVFYRAPGRVAPWFGDRSGQTVYYHGDHLGSASLVTDALGRIRGESLYYPFGATRATWPPESDGPDYGYIGKERDGESGLHHLAARYYDAPLGRFVSVDPVAFDPEATMGQVGPAHPYAYAAGNPIKFTDPSGLWLREFDTAGRVVFVAETSTVRGEEDWVSKLARDLTGDPSTYRELLEPTEATLKRAGVSRVRDFNWDEIEKGDTFRYKGSEGFRSSGLQGAGPANPIHEPPARKQNGLGKLAEFEYKCSPGQSGSGCPGVPTPNYQPPGPATTEEKLCTNPGPVCTGYRALTNPGVQGAIAEGAVGIGGATDVRGVEPGTREHRDRAAGAEPDPEPDFSWSFQF